MDDDLIERALAGEDAAFRRLVDKHSAVAHRSALAFLQQREAAEDAVQEAWLDAWRGLARFQSGRPFRPWLLTLVGNRCRMKLRRRSFMLLPFSRANEVETSNPAQGDPALLLGHDDPVLHKVLTTLSEDQRRILALRFYADLELDEIARIMGLPLGTVKSRLHRTLKRLREQLVSATGDEAGQPEGI